MMMMMMRTSGSDKILGSVKMMRTRKISIIHIHKNKNQTLNIFMVCIPLFNDTKDYFFLFQVFTFMVRDALDLQYAMRSTFCSILCVLVG